ncbi:MAG: hypothetical protein M1816_000954 [Peltula sp. TS41687]|nr:MAG: hypothetical protein M1816_000954 [Peltula sp. TS41687]
MAAKESSISFDDIIKAAREKKKNEALANEIFGRGRRASAPSTTGSRNTLSRPSLASRVGVVKRTSSNAPPNTNINNNHKKQSKATNNINGQWSHDLYRLNNPQASRVSQLPVRTNSARIMRDNRLYAALQSSDGRTNGAAAATTTTAIDDDLMMMNIHRGSSSSGAGGGGLTIRGAAAGPFTVMASNFAPGTTASDIEASMASIGGEILSCRLISAHPTVIAEIIFSEKAGAENVIATFNNQRADGRLLHVYMKLHPGGSGSKNTTGFSGGAPRARSQNNYSKKDRDLVLDQPKSQSQAQFQRRRAAGPANAEIQDGRYGFNDDVEMEDAGGLYSDDIISSSTLRGRRYR